MGFCLSCCRRRQRNEDEERRPLLSPPTDPLKPPRTLLEQAADVLAALHAGKLPAQSQIDVALRRLKQSGLFNPDEDDGRPFQAGGELQKVADDARDVVDALLRVGMEKNHDNRLQDLIYNMSLLSKPINVTAPGEVHVNAPTSSLETAASAIPSQDEVATDAATLISALGDILFLVLTSSAFRLILSDFLGIFREIVANSAEKVKMAAATVKDVAETVEVDMRSAGVVERDIQLPHEPAAQSISVKDTLIGRFEDILRQAQTSPRHNAALRKLLFLLRKYAARISLATDALSQAAADAKEETEVEVSLPIIVPDPRFSRVVEDLKILLERFAGGKSSDPVLSSLSDLIRTAGKAAENGTSSEAQLFFNEIGAWLDRALADPQFASSRAGRETASRLFEDGQTLLTEDADLSDKSNKLSDEANVFFNALTEDRSTKHLLDTVDLLRKDGTLFLYQTAQRGRNAAAHWQTTALRVFLSWVLPRILRVVHTIPMPRVEYLQRRGDFTQLAVALDALLLEAEEALVPDVLQMQEWAEVRVELDERLGAAELTNPNARLVGAARTSAETPSESTALLASVLDMHEAGPNSYTRRRRTQTHSTSRIRLHVEGLRLAVRDVGYYALYSATSWLGYSDEGLASAEIGRSGRRGEGLSLDLELEIDSDAFAASAEQHAESPLYRVVDVRTAVPGLVLHLTQTRHWMLNAILAPLVGPVGRLVAPSILNSQIRSALEKLEEFLRGVKVSAEENAAERADAQEEGGKKDAGAADLWNALLERFGGDDKGHDENNEDEEVEVEVYTESYTEANLKGVVHRTIEQPEPPANANGAAPPPVESAFAVGLGAQLLPGHGEPADAHRVEPADVAHDAAQSARETADEVGDAVGCAAERTRDAGERGIKTAMETRQAIEGAEGRLEARENVERRKRGWRSKAFDLS